MTSSLAAFARMFDDIIFSFLFPRIIDIFSVAVLPSTDFFVFLVVGDVLLNQHVVFDLQFLQNSVLLLDKQVNYLYYYYLTSIS